MRVISAGTGGSSTSGVSGTSNAAQRQTGFAWGYYSSGVSTNSARQLHALLQGSSNVAQRQAGFAWGYYSSGVGPNNARQLHALLQRSTLAQVPQHQGGAASTSAGSGASNAVAAADGWLRPGSTSAGSGASNAVAAADGWLRPGSTSAGSGTQPTSSGISSTTVWIAAVAVLGAVLIGVWALTRRRRKQHEEARDCALSVAGC